MKQITQELRAVLLACMGHFGGITASEWSAKSKPEKWSKKEILGHLIDSALNNHRRFVVTQYAQNENIVYYQDEWVASQHYQDTDTEELIELWVLLNRQIARVLENMPESVWENQCNTGKNEAELHTLEWLAADYVSHLEHHTSQIIG